MQVLFRRPVLFQSSVPKPPVQPAITSPASNDPVNEKVYRLYDFLATHGIADMRQTTKSPIYGAGGTLEEIFVYVTTQKTKKAIEKALKTLGNSTQFEGRGYRKRYSKFKNRENFLITPSRP